MSPPPPTRALFLARASYRQRRLRDALRVLPVLGLGLWLLPLLWQVDPAARTTGDVVLFVFGVWVLLIGLAAVMALMLRPDEDAGPERPED